MNVKRHIQINQAQAAFLAHEIKDIVDALVEITDSIDDGDFDASEIMSLAKTLNEKVVLCIVHQQVIEALEMVQG
jgi:hypothetical protein